MSTPKKSNKFYVAQILRRICCSESNSYAFQKNKKKKVARQRLALVPVSTPQA